MNINKTLLVMAASGALCAAAGAATIAGETTDADARAVSATMGATDPNLICGAFYDTNFEEYRPIFVFQLPSLGAGVVFSSATLNYNLYFKSTIPYQPPTFAVNLSGLNRTDNSATVLNSDFDAAATTLQVGLFDSATSLGLKTSADFSSWLNTQYADGANAGKYVFLRMDPATAPVSESFYTLSAANDPTAGNRPFLDYTTSAIPEPGTYGLLGAGALACVTFLRRRRRP